MQYDLGYFDRCVVLNVDKRIERQASLRANLERLGAKDIRFFIVGDGQLLPLKEYDRINLPTSEAWVRGPFAALSNSYNAFLSYQDIIKQAKEDGLKNICLFEDDVEFKDNFDAVFNRGVSLIEMLQLKWNMLYLGANHTWAKTEEIAHNLLRVNGSVCWHAIAINAKVFDKILAWEPDRPIDDKAKELHNSSTYALWPNCAIQQPGFSNVEGKYRDYSEFWSNKGQQ
jgi:GR25 family glycosyltransferase involved in LPS biosynthesis